MLSVADVPMLGRNFTGIIGVVFWQRKEYRFATYLGAKVIYLCNGMVRIVQGDMELEVRLLEQKGASYFAFETDRAAFEYEYNVTVSEVTSEQ